MPHFLVRTTCPQLGRDKGNSSEAPFEIRSAGIDEALITAYERQRARGGVGAGALQGRRCGACRIEIDRGELARIAAADDDEVLRCPECSAILLRVKGSHA